jgi:cardiolipin synthase
MGYFLMNFDDWYMPKRKKRMQKPHDRKDSFFLSLIKILLRPSRSTKKGLSSPFQQGLIKLLRWGCALGFLILILWNSINQASPPLPAGDQSPILYSNQCEDNLHTLFLTAINDAKHSIWLSMYSLTDPKIIRLLKEKSDEGVSVTLFYDSSTSQIGMKNLGRMIRKIPYDGYGLMHKKILVIDHEKIWIGSANFTRESLRLHDNLVIGIFSPIFAKMIEENKEEPCRMLLKDQHLEYWMLPQNKEEGLNRIISLIDAAEISIKIAMFTWTHPKLTEAILRAHKRGVKVEAVIDYQQSQGASEKNTLLLAQEGVPIFLSSGTPMFHYKFACIDKRILIHGSANWTKAAFSKNEECFLILYPLTEDQSLKIQKIWKVIQAMKQPVFAKLSENSTICEAIARNDNLANKEHFLIFWQRPDFIVDDCFQGVRDAA